MKTQTNDIVKLVTEDHKPLKKLIKIMQSEKEDFEAKKEAFEEFVPLLKAHAEAEEMVLYEYLKQKEDLREEGFEGQVEHKLADQMARESKSDEQANDEDVMSAKIKVLAELVEHHIEEEEKEILPDFKKEAEKETRDELGEQYLQLKHQIEKSQSGKGSSHDYERAG
jgi:hemerythrin-like domain-containing protein